MIEDKKKIIILTGNMTSSFFCNEIDFVKENFDVIALLTYPNDKKKMDDFYKKNKIKYYTVGEKDVKCLFMISFWKWLFDPLTLKEIKYKCLNGRKKIKKILYLIFYGMFYADVEKKVSNIIREQNCNDKIIMYSYWLSRSAYFAARYTKENKQLINYVVSRAHGYDLYEYVNEYNYLPFREYINKNLNCIFFISQYGKNYFDSNYLCNSNFAKRYVSYLGTFNKKNTKKRIIPKDKILIASCSRINKIKRIDLIIDVLSVLPKNIYWIHIGDGKHIDEMKKYCKEKLLDRGMFMGDIDNDKILDIYSKYDVDYFINLSDSEGVPVSIMEALSFGIPIIARNVGGNSEIVNSKVGLLTYESEAYRIVEGLKDFIDIRLKDVALYKQLSSNCIDFWEEKFNGDVNYPNFFNIINNYSFCESD